MRADVGFLILLAFLFLLKCGLDWIEMREDLEEMMKFEEEDEQGEDEHTGAASEDKRVI